MRIRGRPLDFSQFTTLTFDCYGTLIDWESGITAAVRPVLEAHGRTLSDEEILELYGELEPRAQAGGFRPYADVLRSVMDGIADRSAFDLSDGERDVLVRSIGDWPPFPDTEPALRSMKRGHSLWVLSNIDDALFARTRERLGVEFDGVITAEQLHSYKPAPAHFAELIARTGVNPHRVLHIAQSLFHDVAPAKEAGFTTVWVNRRAGRPGAGATPESVAQPDLEVHDLSTLADLIERQQ